MKRICGLGLLALGMLLVVDGAPARCKAPIVVAAWVTAAELIFRMDCTARA